MTFRKRAFFQAAWIVDDLEKEIRRWLETGSVGPFYVIPHVKAENVMYRGAPAALDFSAALAQAGPLQIELIQQHSDDPSAYRDVFPVGRGGFHHLCTFVEDYDAEIHYFNGLGCPAATEGKFGDTRFAYLDTRERLGHITEIIEDRQSIRNLFKTVADAASTWDGQDPIRYL